MLPTSLSKVAVLLLLAGLFPSLLDGQGGSAIRHIGRSNFEPTLDCIRRVYGKPAIWDASVRFWKEPVIPECPASRPALVDTLAAFGFRIFDAQDFVFIIASKLFQPQDPLDRPHAQLKWTKIKIHFNLQTLHENDETPANAREIATEILQRARMIPFNMSAVMNDGFPTPGAVETDLNIALWVGQLGPKLGQSVIALINDRPDFSTARMVYGEMRDGKYVMLWDSPLFNVRHADVYFRDVNGDGTKEIVIESMSYGVKEYPMLVIFDKDGRETSRQGKCDTTIAADKDFMPEDGTCAIFGKDVQFSGDMRAPQDPEDEGGRAPEDIYVRDWYGDGKNHAFKVANGAYVPGPPVGGDFPPQLKPEKAPDPAALNEEGLKLMRARDYASAVTKFMRADWLAGHKSAEYANNVGFALYKAGQYEASVDWLKTTVGIDPKRAVAYLNLGDALVKLNRNTEARESYNRYLELASDSMAAPDVKKKLDALPPAP